MRCFLFHIMIFNSRISGEILTIYTVLYDPLIEAQYDKKYILHVQVHSGVLKYS